jgi:lysophospholipase L1-like esterase
LPSSAPESGAGGTRARPSRAGALAVTVWTLLFLGVIDAGAVFYDVATAFHGFATWRPGLRVVMHPDPQAVPGVQGPSRVSTNRRGMRGPEGPGRGQLALLAFGGSTTECLFLDDARTWPRLVERGLDAAAGGDVAWLGNLATSGANSRHYRLQLKNILPQEERVDLVIGMPGMNDLHRVLGAPAGWRPLEEATRAEREQMVRRAFAVVPGPEAGLEPAARFARRYRPDALVERLRRLTTPPAPPPNPFALNVDGTAYERWRRLRRQAAGFRDDLPDLSAALGEYRRNLRALVTLSLQRGARIVFVTQPAIWRADLEPELERRLWQGGIGRFQSGPGHTYYSPAALARALDLYNGVLLEVCASTPAECIDVRPQVPRDGSSFYDDNHFTDAGARRVADAVVRGIVGRRLLPLGEED